MIYKMVCIDMDGTMLGKRKSISEENKMAVKEVSKRGIKVVVTTGRLYNNAAYYSNLIGASDFVIAGNGAVIKEKYKDKPIFKSELDIDIIKKLLIAAKKCKVVLHLHTIDEVITNSVLSSLITKIVLPDIRNRDFPVNIKVLKDLKNIDDSIKAYKGKVTKCIMFSPLKERTELFRREIDKIQGITYYCSGGRSIEINKIGVSKGNAVKMLAKYYGIRREEIICIGDNENDISMIEYAGLGIAMGNGILELKEKANYITDTNINDGVRKALEKFILNKR